MYLRTPHLLVVLSLGVGAAGAQQLTVGQPAPALQVAAWVKGEAVAEFAKGHVYVVEFWASWSRPCLDRIAQLTALQHQYRDHLTVIGVTTADEANSLDAVEHLVANKGEAIGYTVAFDDGDRTHEAWFTAAAQHDLPSAFVVDGNGVVVWIGHPMWLDVVVPEVLAGKHDAAALTRRIDGIDQRLKQLFAAAQSDPDKAMADMPVLLAELPFLTDLVEQNVFELLLAQGHAQPAKTLGERLVARATKARNAELLSNVAWKLVDPDADIAERNLDLALMAASKAVEISKSQNADMLDTLARVHFWRRDYRLALAIEHQALALATDAQLLGILQAAADEYEAAIERAEPTPARPGR